MFITILDIYIAKTARYYSFENRSNIIIFTGQDRLYHKDNRPEPSALARESFGCTKVFS